jgi:hypothetical protein
MTQRKPDATIPDQVAAERLRAPAAPVDASSRADSGDKPGFDPYKFQRITVPPGLRADIIRWWRQGRNERLPDDTLPPSGGSAIPLVPVRPVRGVVVGAGFALALLIALAVAALGRRPHASGAATSPAQPSRAAHAASVRPPGSAPSAAPAPLPRTPASSSVRTASSASARSASPATPVAAAPPRPKRPKPAPENPSDSAFDRPFSPPK